MKKTIKLNERELHRIISESVKRVLREGYDSEITEIEDYVSSLDAEDAFEYIMNNKNSGLEIELPCGIHFGQGLYAWKDNAEAYLPKDMLIPMRNDVFVSLENPKILKTYIENAFRKNGTLAVD